MYIQSAGSLSNSKVNSANAGDTLSASRPSAKETIPKKMLPPNEFKDPIVARCSLLNSF
jgi:hypothetical protein